MKKYWKPFVSVVIKKENKILCMKRSKSDYFGEAYDMPGGKMEYGEDIYEAALREIKEETNLEFFKNDLTLKEVITWIDDEKTKKRYAVCFCFLIEIEKKTDLKIKLSTEHTSYDWMSKDDERIDDFIRNIITLCVDGKGEVKYWI